MNRFASLLLLLLPLVAFLAGCQTPEAPRYVINYSPAYILGTVRGNVSPWADADASGPTDASSDADLDADVDVDAANLPELGAKPLLDVVPETAPETPPAPLPAEVSDGS